MDYATLWYNWFEIIDIIGTEWLTQDTKNIVNYIYYRNWTILASFDSIAFYREHLRLDLIVLESIKNRGYGQKKTNLDAPK